MKRYIKRGARSSGFTLIEIMTAVSIFAIITTISMGSILTVFDLNRKSESIKTVMDNLNLALESMAREVRFGYRYFCDAEGDYGLPINLHPSVGVSPNICNTPRDNIAFYMPPTPSNLPPPPRPANSLANRTVVYRQNGTRLEKSIDGGSIFTPVTAPEIIIERVDFYVLGAMSSSQELSQGQPVQQPKVLIKITGRAGVEGTAEDSEFVVQTLVSQRRLDI